MLPVHSHLIPIKPNDADSNEVGKKYSVILYAVYLRSSKQTPPKLQTPLSKSDDQTSEPTLLISIHTSYLYVESHN